ncbi:nuclear transport factor 2 family protein [Aquimarina sp. 2201CG14-23]|uniref:nuclear transport factor 2 family protein n=1 Tax=Aquimarina mycalae TaxID=3040073 RepID=UPI0024781405|nr:nuclear transport factor 2 family protein [Aquimarina sp. 2201CG14-23]MDH7444366.1 nuclear transport factor 2 family protein [Aquimarina sp. 2201CG14-23]
MKHFLTLFLVMTISVIQAQESDRKLVEQTVNYYLEGGTNNDFETLKKAFHKTATMKYINNGYQEVNAIEFFGKIMKPGPKQNRKTKIANINISGHAASAVLEIEYPTFTFIDHMNLLKIDNEWKIVNKIFYRKMHDKK